MGGTANIAGSEENDPSYGETYQPSQGRKSRRRARLPSQQTPRPAPIPQSAPIFQNSPMPQSAPISQSGSDMSPHKHHSRPTDPPIGLSNKDDLYLSEPPKGNWKKGLWKHAAKPGAPRGEDVPEHTVLCLRPVLGVSPHGRRVTSKPFYYEAGWMDKQFADELKSQYAALRLWDVGLLQKLVGYKQIAYVHVYQKRYSIHLKRWVVAEDVSITNKTDKESRDAFMSIFRYPSHDNRRWTATVDNLFIPGVMLHFEITESFDSSKINVGLFVAALISLGVALVYGFAMDGDFSTGFSIGSWLLTAAGFFAALLSISEYAGQDSMLDEMDRVVNS
jgi:hypothetical protein